MENLKHCKSHYFWNQLHKFEDQFSTLLGTVKGIGIDTIHNLVDDLNKRLPKDSFCLKLFYDLDGRLPLIHYLFLVDRKKLTEFKNSELYGISETRQIDDRLTNYKKHVDHYFEYHDLFGYERIERIFC